MKSKIAVILCLTQLCLSIAGPKAEAAQRAYKVKKTKKSNILNKKVVTALGLAAVGSAVALYAKHNNHLARENSSSTTTTTTTGEKLWKVVYKGWGSNGICFVGPDPNPACTVTPTFFMTRVNLEPWKTALDVQSSDAITRLIGEFYNNSVALKTIQGSRTGDVYSSLNLKTNLSLDAANQLVTDLKASYRGADLLDLSVAPM